MFSAFHVVCCIAVDRVRGADLTDVAGQETVGVAPGTETVVAVGAAPTIVGIGTASAVAQEARVRAVTRAVHAVEAGPAAATATTMETSSRKPIAKETTVKRLGPHDQMPMRTGRLIAKAVPRPPEMDPEIVHRVRLLKTPAVAVAVDHPLTTTNVGCCC